MHTHSGTSSPPPSCEVSFWVSPICSRARTVIKEGAGPTLWALALRGLTNEGRSSVTVPRSTPMTFYRLLPLHPVPQLPGYRNHQQTGDKCEETLDEEVWPFCGRERDVCVSSRTPATPPPRARRTGQRRDPHSFHPPGRPQHRAGGSPMLCPCSDCLIFARR